MSNIVSGSIGALNASVGYGIITDSVGVGESEPNDIDTVNVQVGGTFVATLTPQVSTDGVTYTAMGSTSIRNVNSEVTSATITAGGAYSINTAGWPYFRITASAYTSGTATVALNTTSATGIATVNGQVNIGSLIPGTAATALGKAEDAAHASGDTGVAMWGVRTPTTPATQTSATGDYGSLAINAEGKLIVSVGAADELGWQLAPLTLTTTTSTAMKAAAGAGIRNYLTDLTIANTSATGVRVDILDGATVIRSYWVQPTSTLIQTFDMAVKSTANAALNVQLSAAVTDVRVSANGYVGI